MRVECYSKDVTIPHVSFGLQWPQGEPAQTGMPEDDPSSQDKQRHPDSHGDAHKPEQVAEGHNPPFMIGNQGVNDHFFEMLRRDAPFPQQQVLFNSNLPARVSRTHSCDGVGTGLGGAAASHRSDNDELHARSTFGIRKPMGSQAESKSGDHAAAVATPTHQSLGKDLSLAAQLHSLQIGSAGAHGESHRRSSDPFLSHGPFSSNLSSLREGSSSNEFNSLKTRATSDNSLPPKAQPKAPEPAAPIDPGTGKQVGDAHVCKDREGFQSLLRELAFRWVPRALDSIKTVQD